MVFDVFVEPFHTASAGSAEHNRPGETRYIVRGCPFLSTPGGLKTRTFQSLQIEKLHAGVV